MGSRTEPENVARLTDYLQERTQDSLRGVYVYDDEGNIEIYYLRDDLQNVYGSDTLGRMARQATRIDQAARSVHEQETKGKSEYSEEDEEERGLGMPLTAFHTFEHAVVLQVFDSEEVGGILAAFEKDVAGTHTRFIEAVREELSNREDVLN